MRTAKELSVYVLEQLKGLEGITARAMMGGYIFYINGKIFGGIYPPGFMVKITRTSQKYLKNTIPMSPYNNAKPMLPVGDFIDNSDEFTKMVFEMQDELPPPKHKHKS